MLDLARLQFERIHFPGRDRTQNRDGPLALRSEGCAHQPKRLGLLAAKNIVAKRRRVPANACDLNDKPVHGVSLSTAMVYNKRVAMIFAR